MDILEAAWRANPEGGLTLEQFQLAVAAGAIRYYVSTNGAMGVGIRIASDTAYLCYVFRAGGGHGLRKDFRDCMRRATADMAQDGIETLSGIVEAGPKAARLLRFYARELGAHVARTELTNTVGDLKERLG